MFKSRRIIWMSVALVGVGVVCLVIGPASTNAFAQGTSSSALWGTAVSASGEPMEGVVVSARPESNTSTTSVFTDEEGQYFFPPLAAPFEAGSYRVWAQAVGYGRADAEVALAAGQSAEQDFTLSEIDDFTHQLNGTEWLDSLPADTRDDRRMKEIFRVTCTECHPAGLALQNRFDQRGWRTMIDLMAEVSYHGWSGPGARPSLTMQYYRNDLARYLAKARGPRSEPLTYEPQPRPTGDAARHVVTEYDIPIAEELNERVTLDGSDWSHGVVSGMHGGGGMHDSIVDDDGNAWITDSVRNNFRTLAKIDTKTGQVTGFKVTAPDGRRARQSHGITKDHNGILWFDTSGALGRVDPRTEEFTLFTPPTPLRVGGSPMVDGKGKIWIGNPHGAIRFDPDTSEFDYFQNKTIGDGQTYGTAADRLGNGWWAQFNMDIVGHANGETGEVSEVRMRPPWALDEEELLTPEDREFFHRIGALRFSGSVFNPGAQAPRRLFADPRGDYVYVANWWGHNLAQIDINTFETTYHRLPINSHPYATAVDRNHMVWTNLSSDDAVARLDPNTGEYTIYRLPSVGTELRHIAVDDADASGEPAVWVVYREASRAARIRFRKAGELQALKNAASGPVARR